MLKNALLFILLCTLVCTLSVQSNDVASTYSSYFEYCMKKCSGKGASLDGLTGCQNKCSNVLRSYISEISSESKKTGETFLSDEPNDEMTAAMIGLFEDYQRNLAMILTNAPNNPGFQLQATPFELSFSDNQAENYDTPEVFSMEVDKASAPFKLRGNGSDSSQWVSTYQNFLSNIKGVSEELEKQYKDENTRLAQEEMDLAMDLLIAQSNCIDKFEKVGARLGYSREKFEEVFCVDVRNKEQEKIIKAGAIQQLMKSNPARYAQYALGKSANKDFEKIRFKKIGSFKNQYDRCVKAGNGQMEGTRKEIHFKSDMKSYTEKHSQSTAYTRRYYGRWYIFSNYYTHSNVKVEKFNVHQMREVKIEFADVQYYNIYPTGWYDSGVLEKLRYYERKEGDNIHTYFGGENSKLTLMPKGVYAVVKPKVTLSLSVDSTKDFVQNINNQGNGFTFLGINFGNGVRAYENSNGKDTNNGVASVVIETTSCDPQIVAFDNHYHN